jgi:hypothetical protein
VPRCRPASHAASLGRGCALLVLTGVVALAQTVPWGTDDLRTGQRATAGQATAPGATQTRSRLGRMPQLGTQPASGAGTTGFDSTNDPRRKRRRVAAAPDESRLVSGGLVAPWRGIAGPAAGQGTRGSAAAGAVTATTSPTPATAPAAPTAPPPAAGAGAVVASAAATVPLSTAQRLRLRRLPEEDPFDAVGVRAGSFILRPAIEVMAGYDTNPERVTGGRGSRLAIISPELVVHSDWERHALDADIRGSYSTYEDVPFADRPNLDAKVDGRVDVNRDTRIDLQGRLLVSTDNPGSPNLQAGLAKLPIFTTVGTSAGIAHRFNRLEIALKGSFDRTDYQESQLTDGTSAGNEDRNFNQYGAQLRGSYELLPGVKPFAEVAVDTRRHDLEVDRSGTMRDSTGITPKLGTTYEISPKLTGEIAVGYLLRTYKDPTLPDLRGLISDTSLLWSASALTSVKLTARSTAEESVVAGVSGTLKRDAGVEVEHRFRRYLIGTFRLGFGLDDYVGSTREDRRFAASAALTYKLTRTLHIKGELRHEMLRSNSTGADYDATIALLGLRLQR